MGGYHCVATTLAGFLQQLSVGYVGRGYWFYVCGEIPDHKDPEKTDLKIISQYGIALSKWARARRKRGGGANLQYLRFDRFYVILATHGVHPFFEAEGTKLQDIRRAPLKFAGYTISYRKGQGKGQPPRGHPSVRIDLRHYKGLKAHFVNLAVHRTVVALVDEFQAVPFEPYAPVRQQLLNILRAVNRARKAAGFEPVPLSALRLRRRPVRVFEQPKAKRVGE